MQRRTFIKSASALIAWLSVQKGWSMEQKPVPALFLAHGSPMNIVADNPYTRALHTLRGQLPRPAAIAVVSAHWETPGVWVNTPQKPITIRDFYNFPHELYKIEYPCQGAPGLAGQTARKTGAQEAPRRGLDHGAWAVLHHLYPDADIPVFQISLDTRKTPQEHFELAKELAFLRDAGVLVIGSGDIVHNLGLMDRARVEAPAAPWALAFEAGVKAALLRGDDRALIDYEAFEGATLSCPTAEHYLPLLYIAALRRAGEEARFVYEGFQHATVSMSCFQVG